jgi:hydrogenase expression/formation protein HypE
MAAVKRGRLQPLDLERGRVDLTHGSGGRAMVQLID